MPNRLVRLLPLVLTLACGAPGVTSLAVTEYTLQQATDSIPIPFRTDVRVGEIWMTLTDVPSDSRCPTGVACVWAGDAIAALAVHPGCYTAGCKAPSAVLTLHTNLEPRAGEGLGYHVQLLALHPEPVYGTAVDSSRYVAWVRVSR